MDVLWCFSLLMMVIMIVEGRPTTTSMTSRPVLKFDPNEGLPEMEVPLLEPSEDSVINRHGLTYLMKFGYLPQSLLETGALRSSHDGPNAIKTFQQFANLPTTGELDTTTLAMMDRRRCGLPDIEAGERISHYRKRRRRKRYSIVSKGWQKLDLKYRIMNYSPDMEFDRIRGDIHRAFKLWTDNSALRFTEVYHGESDIEVHFAKKYHSDGYPFDGKGLTVAHAFYPGPGRGGDIHFDDDETWTWEINTKDVNLFSVAAHQFGHALGLGHSSTNTSLMYPFYRDYGVDFTLPKDDINGIVRLYGEYTYRPDPRPTEAVVTRPAPPTQLTTRSPGQGPDTCRTNYDCITMINLEMFLFKDKYFWRVNSQGIIQEDPIETGTFFYGLPDYVDAAYQSPKYNHIVFFHGKQYWIFNGNYIQSDFPLDGRPITELGLPHDIDGIDAAFVWGYNKRVYLVSGNMYWRFNEEGRRVDHDYPRDISIWQGVPWPVDAAFVDWDGVTHFFKDKEYYTFEDTYMRVKEGFPQPSAQAWLGCPPEEKGSLGSSSNSMKISNILTLLSIVTCILRLV